MLGFIDVYCVTERVRRSHDTKTFVYYFKELDEANNFIILHKPRECEKYSLSRPEKMKAIKFENGEIYSLGSSIELNPIPINENEGKRISELQVKSEKV